MHTNLDMRRDGAHRLDASGKLVEMRYRKYAYNPH